MKDYADTRFVSIGFGFLAGYLYPCYSRFCAPEKLPEQIAAVTADAGTLEEKRKAYPFPIYLNDNAQALERVKPHIILFSPPPAVAPALAEEVLRPYYDSLRRQGEPLPDLYAFPPSPQGDFYLRLLGRDINVCNILPNMTRQIAGVDLKGAEGNTYVTLPAPWPEENRERLEAIFAPLGGIIYAQPENIREILATMCVSEVLPLSCFAIADALGLDSRKAAAAMRAVHQKCWGYRPEGCPELSAHGVSPGVKSAMEEFLKGWTQGGMAYLTDIGADPENARRIMVSNVDLRLHIAQMESRETVESTLKAHATKGGVAERGRLCYELLVEEKLKGVFASLPEEGPKEDFFDFCRDAAYEICRIVAAHGRRLAGDRVPVRFTPEHHAILFGLFVRNAALLAGEAGRKAAKEATLLYADQRGARMAKRCRKNGDPLTPQSYMAYGEWAPEPGTMEAGDVSFAPDVVTEAYVCPWYTAWQRMGFLEEGRVYCGCIDYFLVKGFNRDMELTVESTRPEGGDRCRFVWKGVALDEKARQTLAEKKAALGDSCRKDWIYHTRHLYSAMAEKLAPLPEGGAIVRKTLDDFEVLYGTEAGNTISQVAGMDFYEI